LVGGKLTTYRQKLSFADSVSVHDDSVGFESAGGLVEHHEVLLHHRRQLLDHLHPVGLNANGRGVTGRVGVLASYKKIETYFRRKFNFSVWHLAFLLIFLQISKLGGES
jgi:hypothetical protein